MSTFSGITTSLSALQAQRKRMDVSNQNVSNVNTEGYTRQRVDLSALAPLANGSLHSRPQDVGDGVRVDAVSRMMDQFALNRLRDFDAKASDLAAQGATLSQLEDRFNEPTDTGLTAVLGDFYAAWGDVANNPEKEAPKTALMQRANEVAATMQSQYNGLKTQFNQTKTMAEAAVTDINEAAKSIADLNDQIRMANILKLPASELQDRRDLLINKLTKIAGVEVSNHQDTGAPGGPAFDGQLDIKLGGQKLVEGKTVTAVTLSGTTTVDSAAGDFAVKVGTNTAGAFTGSLNGQLTALNTTLPDMNAKYDTVVTAIKNSVGGSNAGMFTGTTAKDFAVAPAFVPVPGTGGTDNTAALAVSKMATDPAGPIAKWQKIIGDVGVQASGNRVRADAANVQLKSATSDLETSVGVDIDEEMSNLLTSQRAYQAAARMMSAVDESLDVIINRMGRVGL